MNNMMNPTRFTMDENGEAFAEMVVNEKGEYVKFESYIELVTYAIDGTSNKEFLDRQVPSLKKALVDILMLASKSGDADIAAIAAAALAQ
jgi:hypothetical protein